MLLITLRLLHLIAVVPARLRRSDEGFSTAELLGNAALGIFALGLIWVAMGDLGEDVVTWIRGELGVGG